MAAGRNSKRQRGAKNVTGHPRRSSPSQGNPTTAALKKKNIGLFFVALVGRIAAASEVFYERFRPLVLLLSFIIVVGVVGLSQNVQGYDRFR